MYFGNFYEWSCFCKVEFYEVVDVVKNEKVETMSSVKHIYHQINWLLNLKQLNWGWWEKLVIKFSSVEKNVDEEIWDSKTIISREMLIMSLNKSLIAGQDKIRSLRRRNWLCVMEWHDVCEGLYLHIKCISISLSPNHPYIQSAASQIGESQGLSRLNRTTYHWVEHGWPAISQSHLFYRL